LGVLETGPNQNLISIKPFFRGVSAIIIVQKVWQISPGLERIEKNVARKFATATGARPPLIAVYGYS
jgi:hypothetical protein